MTDWEWWFAKSADEQIEAIRKLRRLNAESPASGINLVCICGSTRFNWAMEDARFNETIKGNVVLLTSGRRVTEEGTKKKILDEVHRLKIGMANEILVVTVDDYIGESTRGEIDLANSLGKPVRYVNYPNAAGSGPRCPKCLGKNIDRTSEYLTPIEIGCADCGGTFKVSILADFAQFFPDTPGERGEGWVSVKEIKPPKAPDYFGVFMGDVEIDRFTHAFEANDVAERIRSALPAPPSAPETGGKDNV